jgi:hypothetical protein
MFMDVFVLGLTNIFIIFMYIFLLPDDDPILIDLCRPGSEFYFF